MKKVCENWEKFFPANQSGPALFEEFQTRASGAAAEIIRVKTPSDAVAAIFGIIESLHAKKIVAVNCPLQQTAELHDAIRKLGPALYTDKFDIAEHAESADIGISGVEFGIAETGSVCQDAYAVESRLVSTLPPVHIAILNSNHILSGIKDAFDVIAEVFQHGYISFITGPSRTADIERVLTIGVHGPSRLIILAIDQADGGAA
ncbi:L-lactate dehydrogenase complex protein LldG [Anaerospora hongkongensis]|uniref:L-lactate dehydrogenase complex protein LldG n=1 Tax=Anaerospora hongkongensis TaxID=244830 RepID=A0A4R1PUZ2_9FIRM|nr:lactate utilization protein [Anaerospora hongkongensis]TCL35073.1 L-lactate dehydrogenase complex protein LldG [Anaerospora hongkongensis]